MAAKPRLLRPGKNDVKDGKRCQADHHDFKFRYLGQREEKALAHLDIMIEMGRS